MDKNWVHRHQMFGKSTAFTSQQLTKSLERTSVSLSLKHSTWRTVKVSSTSRMKVTVLSTSILNWSPTTATLCSHALTNQTWRLLTRRALWQRKIGRSSPTVNASPSLKHKKQARKARRSRQFWCAQGLTWAHQFLHHSKMHVSKFMNSLAPRNSQHIFSALLLVHLNVLSRASCARTSFLTSLCVSTVANH